MSNISFSVGFRDAECIGGGGGGNRKPLAGSLKNTRQICPRSFSFILDYIYKRFGWNAIKILRIHRSSGLAFAMP